MWTSDETGLAVWRIEDSAWHFDARGGSYGIGLLSGSDPRSPRFFSLRPVQQDLLPTAGEQYIRGDSWNVDFPQGDGSYALRLALEPIESSADRLVLEVTISIETDLLDTHSKLDVDVIGESVETCRVDSENDAPGSAPISIAASNDHYVAVLLGPHDSPFTTNHSSESRLRLRLFGDFLEKGVIRKARPWLVIDRSGTVASKSVLESLPALESLWSRLRESPLPLTP